MKTVRSLCLGIMAFIAMSPFKSQSEDKILWMPSFGQQYLPWCWAATDQMIRYFYESRLIDQCSIVNTGLGRTDCCTNPTSCLYSGGTTIPGLHTYTYAYKQWTPMTYETMKAELKSLRTFYYSVSFNAGGGHLMAVDGYSTDNAGNDLILVLDPLPVPTGSFYWVTYNEFKGGAGYTYKVASQYYQLHH